MRVLHFVPVLFLSAVYCAKGNEILGCGGFVKSHVPIDFSKVVVKLFTKQGILKDQTNCAPNNGYYFIPLYDKGDYVLKLEPPPGWSFTPTNVAVAINGKNDICSQGKDINFTFKGFGITGKVETFGTNEGPSDVSVELQSSQGIRTTVTGNNGVFFFTPVFPGEYVVKISHPRWRLLKDSLVVVVTEGNTELPPKSLIVSGYDVTGSVKSDGEPITNVKIFLHSTNDDPNVHVEGCENPPKGTKQEWICYVVSDVNGNFIFPSISNGAYNLVPFYKDHKIQFEPQKLSFSISHGSVKLDQAFEIIGFSISGKVLDSANGKPLSGATVKINNQNIGVTKSDGLYSLEKLKAGTYTIQVTASDYQFEPRIMKLNPSLSELPSIFPSTYKVCGVIKSDRTDATSIHINQVDLPQGFVVKLNPTTGEFCDFLKPGTYHVNVNVDQSDRSLQFYPAIHTIEVKSAPIFDITFSQLKAKVSGNVQCQRSEDCANLNIVFESLSLEEVETQTVRVMNGIYTINDVKPGTYRVTLTSNRLCWKDEEQKISVTSAVYTVPPFVNTGYMVTFIASHNSLALYKTPVAKPEEAKLEIEKGLSRHCVQHPGVYNFKIIGCHVYEYDVIEYSTEQNDGEVIISAKKHQMIVSISASQNFGPIYVSVNIGGVKHLHGPLKYDSNKYNLEMFLSPGESAILVPQSEILYFNPPILSLTGEDDCVNMGVKFEAKKGRVFKGKINPPLQGVQITIESENSDILIDESDAGGNYKFPPLDDSKKYKIIAKKNSYILHGPDEMGNFLAHKLAEILVEVVDQSDNSPLQGALLSLSGGESYRSNMQTNEEGKIVFPGLSPSEYFLRPMMKEYSFEPSSKIINVEVGASVKVQLKGKRVAYSAYGTVTSLNNQPEEKMIIVANGIKNCSQYSEEATSESNGSFRIRGLQPYCSYEVRVKGSLDEKDHIERAVPNVIQIMNLTTDATDLRLIVFRPTTATNILVKVYTENPENYRNLRLKISRDSAPAGLVHTFKVDTSAYKIQADYNEGILVQLPSVPLDGKTYSVHLESTVVSLNKGKPQLKMFVADTSFKFVELSFTVKQNVTDQNIKQTSVWALVLLFGCLGIMYYTDKIVQLFNLQNMPIINLDWKSKTIATDFTAEKDDIDQLVENINAVKKKMKPKRI